MFLHALPFIVSLLFVPLIYAGMFFGGWWIGATALFAFLAIPLIDKATSLNSQNIDPNTQESALFWHKLITWAWVPIQVGLLLSFLVVVGQTDLLQGWEIWAMAATIGIATGGIGITYAHELMHQKNRFEKFGAEVLMCSTLYGHFCVEHVFGHHIRVATPDDPATARDGETIYAFFPRVISQSFTSAWEIQAKQLERRGLPVWSIQNAFWRYLAWTVFWFGFAYIVAGPIGVGAFVVQAIVAISLLEMVNYVEHYGLARRQLPNGKYEPTRPHHSWNANHRLSNYLLINLQRHSDHHYKPDRRFALLQAYSEDKAPQLPFGYPTMVLLSLVPPIWFSIMNPRVEAWRQNFYGEAAPTTSGQSVQAAAS